MLLGKIGEVFRYIGSRANPLANSKSNEFNRRTGSFSQNSVKRSVFISITFRSLLLVES